MADLFADLGMPWEPLRGPDWITRENPARRGSIKGSQYTQFWTVEGGGVIRCDICGRPLPGYPVGLKGPNAPGQPRDYRKYLGAAWKAGHPGKAHPGRPREYHTTCSEMNRSADKFDRALAKVEFQDGRFGDKRIDRLKTRMRDLTNSALGSGLYSDHGRRLRFGNSREALAWRASYNAVGDDSDG